MPIKVLKKLMAYRTITRDFALAKDKKKECVSKRYSEGKQPVFRNKDELQYNGVKGLKKAIN